LKRRRVFAFEKLKGFQANVWNEVKRERPRKAAPGKPFLFGFDKDPQVLEKARSNARAAGVENWILFQQRNVAELKAPPGVEKGMIITNPPYGERLEDTALAK
jgi:23S rRNA (guanine2445-N2)-methyltransferase / 23S rRNA (guanine2069-N7)-methyltransferase